MSDGPIAPEKFQYIAESAFQDLQRAYEFLWNENVTLREQVSHLSELLDANNSGGSNTLTKSVPQVALASGELSAATQSNPSSTRVSTSTATEQIDYNTLNYVNVLNSNAQQQLQQQQQQQQQPAITVTVPGKRSSNSTSASSLFNKTTSRLVSSLRPSQVSARLIRSYSGHRDGVWDTTAVYRSGSLIVATASADYAVRLFSADSERPILAYSGHRGSANSVRFYPSPSRDLVLSAAGDSSVHLWEFMPATIISDAHKVPSSAIQFGSGGAASSDDFEASDEDQVTQVSGSVQGDLAFADSTAMPSSIVRIPRQNYLGHQGAVVAADFILGGQQIVSGGWDRLAHVFATETGQLLATLSGHEAELTSVAGHPSPGRPMVLTSSKDASFRMWDLRDRSPQLIAAVQGHTGAVNAAVFAPGDRIISGGDDRAVRVWDVRQLSSPIACGKPGSAVNRLSVNWTSGIIGAPLDNSHVYLYDTATCNKLGRLPRRSGGHRRIVSSLCWVEQQQNTSSNPASQSPNLFTAGFDHRLLGWHVTISGSRPTTAV